MRRALSALSAMMDLVSRLAILLILGVSVVGSTTGKRGHVGTGPGTWDRLAGLPRRLGATQGGGGIGWLNSSRIVHRWSVSPAAVAGVRARHLGRSHGGAAIRRPSCSQQKL
jgi:hypothetical protein